VSCVASLRKRWRHFMSHHHRVQTQAMIDTGKLCDETQRQG
jgi:hypothetical protein